MVTLLNFVRLVVVGYLIFGVLIQSMSSLVQLTGYIPGERIVLRVLELHLLVVQQLGLRLHIVHLVGRKLSMLEIRYHFQ